MKQKASAESDCSDCAAGKYSGPGMTAPYTSCNDCPGGTKLHSGPGADECSMNCPRGHHMPLQKGSLTVNASAKACEACGAGRYTNTTERHTSCTACAAGQSTGLATASSTCTACAVGKYARNSGSRVCIACPTGRVQPSGRGNRVQPTGSSTCTACQPGSYAEETGLTKCRECPAGTYEPAEASAACTGECTTELHLVCPFAGMTLPFAEAGWFFQLPCQSVPTKLGRQIAERMQIAEADRTPVRPCINYNNSEFVFEAGMLSQCTALVEGGGSSCKSAAECYGNATTNTSAAADEVSDTGELLGCRDELACATGYEGYRCSACQKRYNSDGSPVVSETYYKENGVCHQCTDPLISFWMLLGLGVLAFLIVALIIDACFSELMAGAALVAPLLILCTFFQTLSLLVEMKFDWPPAVSAFLERLSFLNFNLELAKPECSIKMDYLKKMTISIVYAPIAIGSLIALYVVFKLAVPGKQKTSKAVLMNRAGMASVVMFLVLSVFYLKAVFSGLACSEYPVGSGFWFLDAEPTRLCDRAKDEGYAQITNCAFGGGIFYICAFTVVNFMFLRPGGKESFGFLTKRMEDKWYWWEMLLLLRKIGIMAASIFNSQHVPRGWLIGSLIIVLALAAHAYARPYQDAGLDLCEFVSLLATLIIFQAGMVVRPPSLCTLCQQSVRPNPHPWRAAPFFFSRSSARKARVKIAIPLSPTFWSTQSSDW